MIFPFYYTICILSIGHRKHHNLKTNQGFKEGFYNKFDVRVLDANDAPVATLKLRLALEESEQHQGLMNIPDDELEKNDGMLFLYGNIGQRVLWMKNTITPLDAAWFGLNGGLVEEPVALHVLDLTYRYSKSKNVQYELEMNQGFWNNLFQEKGITPGIGHVKLCVNDIRQAIEDRKSIDHIDFPVDKLAPSVMTVAH